jgi:hypothetical protein
MNLPLDLEQRCAVPSGRTKFEAYISRRGGRNMAFFDELGKVISDKSKEAANRVKDITGVLQLKSKLSAEKDKINKAYITLGKAYYDRHEGELEGKFADESRQGL